MLFALALPFLGHAQSLKFGYFSYKTLLEAMPEYAQAKASVAALTAQYEAEAEQAAQEFNTKYEQFIAEEKTLAASIRIKRQAELTDLLNRNMAFKEESKKLLAKAEADALAPVRAKLNTAVRNVGLKGAFAAILNTDNNSVPFLNPALGEDVTPLLRAELQHK